MADVKIRVIGEDDASKQLQQVDSSLGGLSSGLTSALSIATGAAAGIAAAGATIKVAMDFGAAGAAVTQTAESFNGLLEKLGASSSLLEQLRTASRGTVDDLTLMRSTMGLLAGANDEMGLAMANAMPQLMEIAKAANKLNPTLGDTSMMFESIAMGIKRGQPEILDNLGITLRLGEAYDTYAASLGKTAKELSANEQKMAILNATLEQGDQMIAQAGGNVDSAGDSFAKLNVVVKNLTDTIKADLAPSLATAAEAMGLILTWSDQVNAAIGKQKDDVLDLSTSYDDYLTRMRATIEVEGVYINNQGMKVNAMGKVLDANYALTAAEYEAAKATENLSRLEADHAARKKAGMVAVLYEQKKAQEAVNAEAEKWAVMNETEEMATARATKTKKAYAEVVMETMRADKKAREEKEALVKKLQEQAEATRQAGIQMTISAGMQALLTGASTNYQQVLDSAVRSNVELVAEYQRLSAQGIPDTADEMVNLTAKIQANNTAQVEALANMRKTTSEMIFQQASQGLGADAALELARGMGLISEQDYAVAASVQQLRTLFDSNRDGMINAAEGADRYAAAILNLNAQIQAMTASGTPITANGLNVAAAAGAGGGPIASGVSNLVINYSPTMSSASAYELQQQLTPIINSILRERGL
jgi:hypothetical protein